MILTKPQMAVWSAPLRSCVLLIALTVAGVAGTSGRATAGEPWGPGDWDVVVSEIHYHPPGDKGSLEFVEVHNPGVHWVDLGGWQFTSGVKFTFAAGTVLEPGGHLAVARDAESFREVYGSDSRVVGDFEGRLSNSDDVLELRNRSGTVVAWIHYYDGRSPWFDLWPREPDGDGLSLELIQAHPDWGRPWYWAPSLVAGGTPGARNSVAGVDLSGSENGPNVTIVEARLEEDGPFVELANDGASTASLSQLRLTRDVRGAGGSALTGSLGRGRLSVLTGDGAAALAAAKGKVLFLVDSSTGHVVDSLALRGSPEGGSVGREPGGAHRRTVTFDRATPGKGNGEARRPAVVIHEIHYHPLGGGDDEFVELYNAGTSKVELAGWRLGRAIDFEFPEGATLPGKGYAVVAKDPDRIRPRIDASGRERLFGPAKGKLSNSGDCIVLRDARGNIVDEVPYSDRDPWPEGADGKGFSVELTHPEVDNRWGPMWTLGPQGGTPGAKNARALRTVRPVVVEAWHEPAIPRPGEKVTVHARVAGSSRVSRVSVAYAILGTTQKTVRRSMSDSGKVDDGAARDGHYAVSIPVPRAGSVLGFAIVGKGSSGRPFRFPIDPTEELHLAVTPIRRDGGPHGLPTYAVWMNPTSWQTLVAARRRSKPLVPCTFAAEVSGPGVRPYRGKVVYGARLRFRGNNSFHSGSVRLFSYRLRLPDGQRFDGRLRINLHGFETFRQKAGNDILGVCGLPCPRAAPIRFVDPEQVHETGYLDMEVVDSPFLEARYGSTGGEIFRGKRAREMGNSFGADFSWHGRDPEPYLRVYVRANKSEREDADDLIALIEALNTSDKDRYAEAVRAVLDPAEWARYFAGNHVIGNREGGLANDDPDDYFLAQRPTDGKFVLVPWDHDTTFESVQQALLRPRLPAIRRFLLHPEFAPLYHRAVHEILDGPLSRASLARRQRYWSGFFPEGQLAAIADFVDRRQQFIDAIGPRRAAVGLAGRGTSSGGAGAGWRVFVEGDPSEVALEGWANPAVAAAVRIGGAEASFDPITGRWTATVPVGGVAGRRATPFWVEMRDVAGKSIGLESLRLERVPRLERVSGRIAGRETWSPERGPYLLEGDVTISGGASLTVAAGTQILCAGGVQLEVAGSLKVEGQRARPVAFCPAELGKPWVGIRLGSSGVRTSGVRHQLTGCRIEGAGGGGRGARGVALWIRSAGTRLEECLIRGTSGTALRVESASVEIRDASVVDALTGVVVEGGELTVAGLDVRDLDGDGVSLRGVRSRGERAIRGLRVRRAARAALRVEGGVVEIADSSVQSSLRGIEIQGGAKVRVVRSAIAGNSAAIMFGGTRTGARAGTVDLVECAVWPNDRAVDRPEAGTISVDDCLAPAFGDPGAALEGAGVVSGTPRYEAPQWGDLRWKKGGG